MTTPDYVASIRKSGLTIYDPLPISSPFYIPTRALETILDEGVRGLSVEGLALRTRSKVVKTRVCEVLGYPVPKSFRKEKPRFLGQNLDIYTQTSNNLQVWNEDLNPLRRYAIIRECNGRLARVRVVTGEALALLDKTGTLTGKYQARLNPGTHKAELVAALDTEPMLNLVGESTSYGSPIDFPTKGFIMPIATVFERLKALLGRSFPDAGRDQERNRGAGLHRLVCEALGYTSYADSGQFPDITNQVLEVKLQTSPTIDLGQVTPASTAPVGFPPVSGITIRHCDCRYAIFSATTDGANVTLNRVYLTTGTSFFARFPQFGGKVINSKIQIPLPSNFF